MFKSVFIKNFRIIFICFCFIQNKCYSEDCCKICYNCCCNCLNSEEGNNENEEKEESEKKEEDEKGNIFKEKKIIFDRKDHNNDEAPYRLVTEGTEKNNGILGEGLGGSVLKVEDKNSKEILAIKRITKEEKKIDESVKNEVVNMYKLKNLKKNDLIVKLYDAYISEYKTWVQYFLVMEYCENGDLFDFIFNDNISDKESLKNKIAYQLINAVYFCHENNIVHKDIKPDNIFVDKYYNAKLGDFGFSKVFNDKDAKCEEFIGTRGYCSFELLSCKPYNPYKNDLFSLGATLYALYKEDNLYDGKEKNFEEEFNKIPGKLDDIQDEKLRAFLTGLVEKEEEKRCGWEDIFKSEFYKELKEKYEVK